MITYALNNLTRWLWRLTLPQSRCTVFCSYCDPFLSSNSSVSGEYLISSVVTRCLLEEDATGEELVR